MLLYFFRHGIAEDQSKSGRDEDRVLTEEGREKVGKAARGLKGLGVEIDHIFSSPLPRALETAEIVGKEIIRKKTASTTLMYVIFIFVAVAVGAPVLFGLSSVLVEIVLNLSQKVPQIDTGDLNVVFGEMIWILQAFFKPKITCSIVAIISPFLIQSLTPPFLAWASSDSALASAAKSSP